MPATSSDVRIHVKRGHISVRDSEFADVWPISERMRKEDVEEVWASHNVTPLEALRLGFQDSRPCMTALIDGRPFAMFGLVPQTPTVATIWFLATPDMDTHPASSARISRYIVDKFLNLYPILGNYVDARNKKSVAWLKWLGAKLEDPLPYGEMKLPFHFFTFSRNA